VSTPTLLGLPYDASSSFRRGAAGAPAVIRAALRSPSSNAWSESLIDLGLAANLDDAGDLDLGVASGARERIEHGIRALLAEGARPISLGGDHSVTYPIIRGFGEAARSVTILQIDAHGDLYPDFQGDRYSHACPFARILEEGVVRRLVQAGIRTLTPVQHETAQRHGVDTIDMRRWVAGDRPTIAGPVYVSIDLDAMDPAFAPGVSHHEPGGLSVRDVVSVIQSLTGPIVGADVVELNPDVDSTGVTAMAAAKLVKELASRMIETAAPTSSVESATGRG
jgi:arginase